ncbi:MAG TPA: hypothetical protein PKM70_02675 [Clostridia bacterium]|nr:hypothetical protein [Clostridia bacterium]
MKKLIILVVTFSLFAASCSNTSVTEKERVERVPNPTPDVIKPDNKYVDVPAYDKFGQWPYKDGEEYYSSKVGTWFTVWWTDESKPTHDHWFAEGWTRLKPVDYGYYSSGDEDYLTSVLSRLKYIGVDYLMIDDTNGHWNDFGLIAKNIEQVFKVANELGENSPQIAIATGGPLRDGNTKIQEKELDVYWKLHNDHPGTFFQYKGKPFLIMYIAGEVNKRHSDDRFTIRHGTGFISWQKKAQDQSIFQTEGNWGWVFDIQNEGSEVIGVQPGYNKAHQGIEIQTIYRENGKHYIQSWLNAIKQNPEMIIIPSYNDHAEETGWEATVPIRPPSNENCDQGTEGEDPYLYEKITEAYLALRYGFIDGFMYREENSKETYLFKNNKLAKVEPKETDLVIIIPDGYFEWESNKNTKK